LWFIKSATTSNCVYGLGSFAIHSLRFFLISAIRLYFLVEISSLGPSDPTRSRCCNHPEWSGSDL